MIMPLLCAVCEERFNKRGESEVLRHIAGKTANKLNPIVKELEPLPVREEDHTLKSYCGTDAGLNMDMFAYFALSMAWRGTHSWQMAGDKHMRPLRLGFYEEPIRRLLLAQQD